MLVDGRNRPVEAVTRGPLLAFNGNGFTFGKFMYNMDSWLGEWLHPICLRRKERVGKRPPEMRPREPLCEAHVTPGGC